MSVCNAGPYCIGLVRSGARIDKLDAHPCALILQARLLSAEHLEGENKYHCAFCESKVDATRQIRLHCVPPVLCLSLQRFVFDMKVRPALPGRHAYDKEQRLAVAP